AGRARITYPDGSTAQLEQSSEISIEFVRTTAGDYIVRMQQTLGRVWYAVTRTVGSGGRYEVRSGAMASVIRAGSGSYVEVNDGETTVVATSGHAGPHGDANDEDACERAADANACAWTDARGEGTGAAARASADEGRLRAAQEHIRSAGPAATRDVREVGPDQGRRLNQSS